MTDQEKQSRRLEIEQESQFTKQVYKQLRARNRVIDFIKYTKPDYQVMPFHKYLCDKLDDFISGKIKRLIVKAPPRHGKSEIVSRRLPPFIFGKFPDAQIIAASYSGDLSSRMNRDVQRIMETQSYREVFPLTRIKDYDNKEDFRAIRNNDLFEIIGHKGVYRSAGIGGGITGMGADFCFISGTKILSSSGEVNIESIKIGDYVWSYNHATNTPELKKVENISSRRVSRLVQVTSTSGRKVSCTPEHPFYSEEFGYRKAEDLRFDTIFVAKAIPNNSEIRCDSQMRIMHETIHKTAMRIREIVTKGTQGALLLKRMFTKAPQYKESKIMHNVREASREENKEILQLAMHSNEENYSAKTESIQSNFQKNESVGRGQRWMDVLHMWFKKKNNSSSYKSLENRRQTGEPNNNLFEMPYIAPQIQKQKIARIESNCCGEVEVFNLEIQGNHNFFAEGILVHNCIIDDPIKDAEQADSATYRNNLWEWYGTTLYSRLEKNAGVLICATSWHQDDLSHRLIDLAKSDPTADQWEIVSFPAISEDNKALWPDKYPLSELLKMKSTVGSRVFSALWQQEPSSAEGSMIKRSWIKFYKQKPDHFDEIIQSWDLTVKDKPQNDRTVGHVWGRLGASKYLLDRMRGNMDINDEMIAIRGMHAKWPKAYAILVEDKANGPAVITLLKNEIPGLIPFDPKTSKANRLAAVSPEFEAGNVYFPDPSIAPWISDTIEELVSFPTAKHDDEVDATTMALLRLRQSNVGDIPNLGRYALGRTYAPSLRGSDSW